MTVAVIGGLGRLERQYSALADEYEDMRIKVFNEMKRDVGERVSRADGVVLVTNLVSHAAARQVYRLARERGVRVIACHRASVSAMRDCIEALTSPVCEPAVASPAQRQRGRGRT